MEKIMIIHIGCKEIRVIDYGYDYIKDAIMNSRGITIFERVNASNVIVNLNNVDYIECSSTSKGDK